MGTPNYNDWDTFADAFGGKKKKKAKATSDTSASQEALGQQRLPEAIPSQGYEPSSRRLTLRGGRTDVSNQSLETVKGPSKPSSKANIPASGESQATEEQDPLEEWVSLPAKPKPDNDVQYEEPKPVYIALMGVTGTGKSTLISHCSKEKPTIGHTMTSCKIT